MENTNNLRAFNSFAFLLASFLLHTANVHAAAFPGAEGYGANATGGRGGQVIHVTTLDATGPGSLQEALDTSGPRIIVFDVSGVITANEITIRHGDFTLAGETAPGGGITLNAQLNTPYRVTTITNFIIRHIRIRPTNLSGIQGDAIQIASNSNFILDHISVCWGSDETIDVYESHDFTVQWSTIEESTTNAHPQSNHNYGFINGPDGRNVSLHHNLFAHHNQRTPAIANGMSDIINNVSYNFRRGFNHHNPADTEGFNFIGNYYKAGPNESNPIIILIDDEDKESGPYYYLEDLYYNGVASDPWDLVGFWPDDPPDNVIDPAPSQAGGRFNTPAIKTHSSTDAYDLVLSQAGAWPRDTVTLRTINEVETGTGSWGREVPQDLMEGLIPETAPTDSDNDGMPDDWETARGLNPNVADDDGDDDGDDYTNIEEYLHDRSNLLIYGDSGGDDNDGGSEDPAEDSGPGDSGGGSETDGSGGSSGCFISNVQS
jgi:pectate lyase